MKEEIFTAAAGEMASKMDAELSKVLDEVLRVWTYEMVKARCTMTRPWNSQVVTFYIDGVPHLEIHPIEIQMKRVGDAYKMVITQKYRRLPSTVSG